MISNSLYGLDYVKALADEIFSHDNDISVVSVEETDSHTYSIAVDIDILLSDADFDVDVDEDYPKNSRSYFTGSAATRGAPLAVLKSLSNNGKINLESVDYDYKKHTNRLRWSVVNGRHSFFYTEFPRIFDVDELELDVEPTIKVHSCPMRVRGVMDCDPPEYEYEVTPATVKVRCYIVLYC